MTRPANVDMLLSILPFLGRLGKAVVSCGCYFDGKKCSNVFPECPTFTDPGLDFGNGAFSSVC
jgi:hypothetical protein